ncbi:lipopolysaccharide biosynthesis protein [Spirosoma sp. KNUC1025]|uniref:lipopolysaccharide biosynthesis protein n=1 Tax=Spirosoma sp. KNUC1025 TaxID=2894082 RepID=UPI003863CEF3|nr:polysaccharide biosynthesis C-terminal domain-containing protein [Spirosoma sp. KNUC1025]
MLNRVRNALPSAPARSLILLACGQGIAAVAGLSYGKLAAIYISPTVWGEYSLLFITMALLYSLFITPTLQSFKAALSQFSPKQVFTFYSRMLAGLYLALALPVLLATTYYQTPIFGIIWGVAVGQGIFQFGSNYLNATGQHRGFTLLQAGNSLSTLLVFTFVVIGFHQRTLTGIWLVLLIVNSSWSVIVIWRLFRTHGTPISHQETTAALYQPYRQYVGPLVSLAFWGWLINYADRFLIRIYLSEADVGQYAMGYGLGSKLLLLVAPLLSLLSPKVLQTRAAGKPPETANPLIGRYLIYYVFLASAVCLFYYANRDWIGNLLLSENYTMAYFIGPIVAAGYLFLTSIHLLELKWYVFGHTKFVLWHNVLGAILHVGFNLLLIPRMGITGAAIATLTGFVGQFLLACWLFMKPTKSVDS